MKTSDINKTVYISPEFLEELKKGQEKFNFSKRVNQLLRLGLQVDREILDNTELEEQYIFQSTVPKPLVERLTELIKLGLDTESNLIQNKMTTRMAIEHLAHAYNRGHKDSPIIIN